MKRGQLILGLIIILISVSLFNALNEEEELKPLEQDYDSWNKLDYEQKRLIWSKASEEDKKSFLEYYSETYSGRKVEFKGFEDLLWGEWGVIGNPKTFVDLNRIPKDVKSIEFKDGKFIYDFGKGKTAEMDAGWLSEDLVIHSLNEDGSINNEKGFGGFKWNGEGKFALENSEVSGDNGIVKHNDLSLLNGAKFEKTINGKEVMFEQFWAKGKEGYDSSDLLEYFNKGKKPGDADYVEDEAAVIRFSETISKWSEAHHTLYGDDHKNAEEVEGGFFKLQNVVVDTPDIGVSFSRENLVRFFYNSDFTPSSDSHDPFVILNSGTETSGLDIRAISSQDYLYFKAKEGVDIERFSAKSSGGFVWQKTGETEERGRYVHLSVGDNYLFSIGGGVYVTRDVSATSNAYVNVENIIDESNYEYNDKGEIAGTTSFSLNIFPKEENIGSLLMAHYFEGEKEEFSKMIALKEINTPSPISFIQSPTSKSTGLINYFDDLRLAETEERNGGEVVQEEPSMAELIEEAKKDVEKERGTTTEGSLIGSMISQ